MRVEVLRECASSLYWKAALLTPCNISSFRMSSHRYDNISHLSLHGARVVSALGVRRVLASPDLTSAPSRT